MLVRCRCEINLERLFFVFCLLFSKFKLNYLKVQLLPQG